MVIDLHGQEVKSISEVKTRRCVHFMIHLACGLRYWIRKIPGFGWGEESIRLLPTGSECVIRHDPATGCERLWVKHRLAAA